MNKSKLKRTLSIACASALLLPALGAFTGCGQDEIVLRVYSWEEYIDDGDEGSFIYDELHEKDEDGVVHEIESDIVDEAYMARYEAETGLPFDKQGTKIIDDFEAWYEKTYDRPIRVEYSTFGTNEDLYNQLKLGDMYDLVCPSEYMIMKLASEDMIEPLPKTLFDETNEENSYVRNVSPYIRDIFDGHFVTVHKENGETEQRAWGEYAAGYMWGTTGIIYNPELVDEDDLTNWNVMLNDKYKNKVTTKDNVRDTYFIGLAILHEEELLNLKAALDAGTISESTYTNEMFRLMNDTSPETVAKVQDILLEMKSNIYGFETDSGKLDMVKGIISMNFAWSGDAVYALDEAEKADVLLNYFVPEECANLFFDGWVMPKNEKRSEENRHAATAFINFLSKPHNAIRNMYYIGYTSVIAGDEVLEYNIHTYGVEEGDEDEAVPYDISYFFGEEAIIYTYE